MFFQTLGIVVTTSSLLWHVAPASADTLVVDATNDATTLVNTIVDLIYGALDPRVRYE